jgi:RNA polymerase sigma-70 factor (ECF subfamily)
VPITGLTETVPHPLDAHVAGIRTRSDKAFRAVYDATADDLVSFAFGMLSDRKTAEDVVQQAFVELVKSAHKIKGDGRALRAWLYKSVRFGCLDEYRRRSRRPEIPHEVLPDSHVLSDPLADHLDPVLEIALNALSKRHRTVVLLRHVVGLTPEEIATVIGSTRRATYAVLSRAESRLRALLDDES